VLRAAPQITSGAFLSVTSSPLAFRCPEVTSRYLTSLDVELSPAHVSLAFSSLFDSLTTPALQALSLSGASPGGTILHTSLISFLFRSACPLVRLSIPHIKLTENELKQCLAVIPSLVELKLEEEMELSSQTLQNLTLRPHSTYALLPNLQTFVYTGKSEINFSALSSMALSRWRMGIMYDDVDGPHERSHN
jgi:hypothetical protein